MKFRVENLDEVVKHLQAVQKDLDQKLAELIGKLSELGIQVADARFASAMYDGERDVQPGEMHWLETGKQAEIVVSGRTVLFIEFGTGLMYAHIVHPDAARLGYGASTWSESPWGKGEWANPKGWYYAPGRKSFGNPPAKAMYEAGQEMRRQIETIAKEVFG